MGRRIRLLSGGGVTDVGLGLVDADDGQGDTHGDRSLMRSRTASFTVMCSSMRAVSVMLCNLCMCLRALTLFEKE